MRRKLAAVAISSALLAGISASPASADPGVGQPTFPQCYGQTVSFLAQTFGGIRNAAEFFGVTNHQGHNILRALCGRTSGFTPTP